MVPSCARDSTPFGPIFFGYACALGSVVRRSASNYGTDQIPISLSISEADRSLTSMTCTIYVMFAGWDLYDVCRRGSV